MIAVISLVVVAAMFVTAARVATIALVGTGMSTESAAFQARSALMGVGFTTVETEAAPRRRGDWLASRPLSQLGLPDEGVVVLGLQISDANG